MTDDNQRIATGSLDGATMPREERMERTRELFERIQHGTASERAALEEEIILLNRCVADSIASRYTDRGISAEDLRQTAYLGLMKAVRGYDPSHQRDLLSYAVPTIRGELRRYFRDHGWTIRPPRGVQELQHRARQCREQLSIKLEREPRIEEIAAHLGEDVDQCRRALNTDGCFTPASLDATTNDRSGFALLDTLVAPDERPAAEARALLGKHLRELSERERLIVELRFYEGRTQSEIGAELGVTQMQVSRLLSAIFGKLRSAIGRINEPVHVPAPRPASDRSRSAA